MYRDLAPMGPLCHRHANAAAAASCLRCEEAICELCLVYDLAQPHCFPCAKRARRLRQLGGAALLTVVVGVLGSLVGYVVSRPRKFDYGVHAARIAGLQELLSSTRCDRDATLELDETMVQAGNARAALADSDAYFARCGEWPRLRWVRYSADERLGDHAGAIAEASRLIEHDPEDHDYRWWRGVVYELVGQDDAAIADYRQAIALTPALMSIPFNLARLLERQGRPCEAMEPILQFLAYHPERQSDRRVLAQLNRLDAAGHCGPSLR
jgi:aspartyl protease family protein